MNYTKYNLNEVKDSAKEFGYEGNHEARFPSKELGLTQSGMGYEIIYPGKHIPFGHSHAEQEEVYIVMSGSGQVKIDDEVIDVEALDAIRVSPQANRAFMASDSEKLVLLIFGSPKTDIQDATMLPDPWEHSVDKEQTG